MFSAIIELALRNILFFALHFEQNSNFPKPLSRKEELECIRLISQGDEKAKEKLIVHNLRLVAYIVKKHYPDYVEQEDLISIGTVGLIRATETFDETKSVNFSTYAGKCIDNQVKMHFRKIKHQQTEIYMDAPIDSDKDGNLLTIADIFKDTVNVDNEVELRMDREKLYRYINEQLDEREKLILCKRYELNYNNTGVCRSMTQQEVADMLNISRSYVSRIEKKALGKLRNSFERRE